MHTRITKQANGSYRFESQQPFEFLKGGRIPALHLVYETYGTLNNDRSNVILVHHALSTSSHLCSLPENPEPGWWEAMVGPGKVVDTDKFYVICINNLGSCFGSSGPITINPDTQQAYGKDFPALTIDDMVLAQRLLLQALNIDTLYAVIGNSMGAMLSLAWAIYFPESTQRLISISSCYKSYPINTVRHKIAREIVALDTVSEGVVGFKLARMLDHLNYRSAEELNERFTSSEELQSYLAYNAQKFLDRFDINAYLYLTQAMDWFDAATIVLPAAEEQDPFARIKARAWVISVTSDTLFRPYQQKALFEKLKHAGVDVDFILHDSDRGHDAFYNDATIGRHIASFLW